MGYSFDLSGRTALVTGASSGLGANFARALAAAGATVVAAARRADRLDALVEEIVAAGGEAHAVTMDVADAASIRAGFAEAEAAVGPINIFVGNAGVAGEHMALDQPESEIDALLTVNLRGVVLSVQEAAQRMVASGSADRQDGRIIIIGSITAEKIFAGAAVYGATKAAVRHLGRSLAREWARKGINVNVIQPGYFLSEMTEAMINSELGKRLIGSFPRQRLRDMTDLNAPLLWLASDASSGITGTVITVDDGQSL
ncbi:MAG: SDR family NAD(P)-dependent oxidoreductase [Sphingopyxis sp.]|nr:SDR family NAD(P)-dependent oxidoreductase [Sphingopyxis sp.]